jgi:hypothetical protein
MSLLKIFLAILLVIILLLVLVFYTIKSILSGVFGAIKGVFGLRENMTKIYRGVGFYNTGNDPINQVAAGVVNSGIIADYTNTYNEGGGRLESCDLCPNKDVCPHCPQFKLTPEKFKPVIGLEAFETIQPNYETCGSAIDFDISHERARPYDIDTMNKMYGYPKSECPSAVKNKIMHGAPLGMFNKSADMFEEQINDDTNCKSYATRANEILYKDIFGLDVAREPASDECEFFGINGYVYKEPCDMKYIMDEQAKIMAMRSSTNRN